MKIGRFKYGERTIFGIIKGREIVPVKETRVSDLMESITPTDEVIPIRETKFLSPTRPSKIVAVGLNYKAHAEEMGKPLPEEPLLFLKPSTAVIANKMRIVLPSMSNRVDYEGELAVVIGKKCRKVTPEEAKEYILGYSCFNDVTARDLQQKDVQYTRAKSFDTFAPYGPWIATDIDPIGLKITTKVNGEVRQEGNTEDMIFSPFELVSFISQVMTLLPGDVIATGTPPGVGPLNEGDRVEVDIEGIGTLINYTVKES
ncbi:2-keto-4-pentenoate hydratase/2-oxohepta-3-ene-1,7-dioic acid hydratase in catechol pathway [Thermovibrio guaymasensis]|uniref:2-keto-4-pentenoate hydratase/2-oxohepta-3-ene-1,7-dioic acid hydratase in catechol pathway n=1 Tax=Thermovibrio guaymasensis TaxID=240167 RepID=A0A420W8V4_9BACT|nr:fumarylacetoacetate hydrolase family protein [Thermovibrio guaymasensis]RKQ63749.1 2-keto-4-pentenoate hydratase/2-oxohepta-3-ene-1,7-dioic acid hydratase in catechol pathway [Thermovibrio guaymasensis]